MSWVKSLVRKAAAVTTGRVFGGSPPSAAAVAVTTASVAGAGAGGAAAAAGAGAAAASAQPKAVAASEELEQLRAENAKLKHAFHVIKVKIDKAGKASAVADGADTPAASLGAQSNQEIRDIIARVMAQERQRVAAAAAAGRQRTGADDAAAGADAAAAASADAALAASITASEAAAPAAAAAAAASAGATAPAAPAMAASTLSASTASLTGATGATGAATVVASAPPAPTAADAKDAFAAAQAAKYGVSADGKSDNATPVAMYYGEDVYSSKEEAESQAGVKLLCYGNVGVTGGGKKVVARDPRFASAVFASDELGTDEEEVIIVDLDETATTAAPAAAGGGDGADAHWWTVVDNPNPKESADDAAELAKQEAMDQFKEEPALHLEGPRGTAADGFALVEQEDMINAISDYSAQCVRRFAGAKQLDPQSLQRMLQSTFAQVEPPSTVGKLWQYGQLAYTGYGWASYAYYLYRTPAVWRGAYSVVKWALVLLV